MKEEKKDKLFVMLALTVGLVGIGVIVVAAIRVLTSLSDGIGLLFALGLIGLGAVSLIHLIKEAQIKERNITKEMIVAVIYIVLFACFLWLGSSTEIPSLVDVIYLFSLGSVIGLGILVIFKRAKTLNE